MTALAWWPSSTVATPGFAPELRAPSRHL